MDYVKNLNDYQQKASKFVVYQPEYAAFYTALGLAGEAGELAGKISKLIRDGEVDDEDIKKELGDVLWFVAECGRVWGFSLEEIANTNLLKLEGRLQRNTIKGSGDER